MTPKKEEIEMFDYDETSQREWGNWDKKQESDVKGILRIGRIENNSKSRRNKDKYLDTTYPSHNNKNNFFHNSKYKKSLIGTIIVIIIIILFLLVYI